MKGRKDMSKKDFDDYYNKICGQFFALNDVFNELSEEVSTGMVEPERLKQLELTIKPIKESYQTLSYIKYLLDKPTRKNKASKYKKMNKKFLEASKEHSSEEVIDRNKQILNTLKQ